MKKKLLAIFFELFIVFIITVPAFFVLLNQKYPSMHDDQHIARLYLLDRGLKQGAMYPRWVGELGFGYGYPLFNFYPPLIYYVAEIFHVFGFSFIWSIKLMVISGFVLASFGAYYLLKPVIGRISALAGSVLFTYAFYHAVNSYVRGAFAEFFAMGLLPFLFLGFYGLYRKRTIFRALVLGVLFGLLILTHPLIAFPAMFFFAILTLAYMSMSGKNASRLFLYILVSCIIGLGLSAFYWLPSMAERSSTMVNAILTKELASYKDHYVYPQQLWYSPWGYGGSVKGLGDGLTFQLGKVQIYAFFASLFLCAVFVFLKRRLVMQVKIYLLYAVLLIFSLWMATPYSSFVWDHVRYLWYLQFPWRFLTFSALLIAVSGSFGVYFAREIFGRFAGKAVRYERLAAGIAVAVFCVAVVLKYHIYFRPQRLLQTSDAQRTSYQEIAWRVSSTSYEFVPKGVQTKKTKLGTTTLAIEKKDIPESPYSIVSGDASVAAIRNNFSDKQFFIETRTPTVFRLNTYDFPGWSAFINGKKLSIGPSKKLHLITVSLPGQKQFTVSFRFENTPVRIIADWISICAFVCSCAILIVIWRKKRPQGNSD